MAPSDAELKAIFTSFDADGSGRIDLDELTAALAKGGKKMSRSEVENIVKLVDKNHDGEIDFDEFREVFKLAPDLLPPGLKELVDVSGFFLKGLTGLGKAVIIDAPGALLSTMGSLFGLTKSESGFVDISDTNVEKIGSEEDKAVRKQAAQLEEAWAGCGQSPGIEIWRVEAFKIKPWPKEMYGRFYEGDSYVVLHTYKESADSDKLAYDLYFWLGKKTTQDEMGTAAYKTVELDDLLDGVPIQHREVMMHESAQFKGLFKAVSYLKGGVASAFNHVEPNAYISKLLHVKKVGKTTSIIEVPCKRDSLNEGDAFVLDTGATIYVWAGSGCSPFETLAANLAAENLEASRHGAAKATHSIDDYFWKKLGGAGKIKSKDEAGELLPTVPPMGEGALYRLSDSTGKLSIEEVGRGDLTKSMLSSDDVFVVDPGPELIVWIGSGASQRERAAAMNTATQYLKSQGKPITTPVSVIKEGSGVRHATFQKIFAN